MNINLEIFLQTLLIIITVCGAIYGMMKFLLKDINMKISMIDEHIKEIKDDNKQMEMDWKEERRKTDQRVTETNKRMDGVYHLLLKRMERTEP